MANNYYKKERKGGIVYSTNPGFRDERDGERETGTVAPGRQDLRVTLDSRQRNGKTVTLVRGFAGTDDALKELARLLKSKCSVGGSAKDGEIIIQGDFKEKIIAILRDNGYRAR